MPKTALCIGFFLTALLSSCVISVSTCHPLKLKEEGRCPLNDDWKAYMARMNEHAMCTNRLDED
jgi:hypothetical protein